MECEMGTFSHVLILICSTSTIKGLTLRKRGKIRSIEREWKRRSELPNDWWILRNFPLPRFSRDRWKELDRFYQRGSITDNINERKNNINSIKCFCLCRCLFVLFVFSGRSGRSGRFQVSRSSTLSERERDLKNLNLRHLSQMLKQYEHMH